MEEDLTIEEESLRGAEHLSEEHLRGWQQQRAERNCRVAAALCRA